jgi:hypothetical protein
MKFGKQQLEQARGYYRALPAPPVVLPSYLRIIANVVLSSRLVLQISDIINRQHCSANGSRYCAANGQGADGTASGRCCNRRTANLNAFGRYKTGRKSSRQGPRCGASSSPAHDARDVCTGCI